MYIYGIVLYCLFYVLESPSTSPRVATWVIRCLQNKYVYIYIFIIYSETVDNKATTSKEVPQGKFLDYLSFCNAITILYIIFR